MKRVLLIDDEPAIGPLVELCLGSLDVDVVLARNLSEALETAREGTVGLVLLDLALGSEDGLAILPKLREEPALAGVPIVAFTAHDSRKREALASGVDFFIARPFATADLEATVDAYLVR